MPGRLVELAADGGPKLNEFVPAELSAALGVSQQSITLLICDLLDLEYRHPLLWDQVRTGQVPLWQARKITQCVATVELGLPAAVELDRRLTPTLPGLTVGRSLKLLEGLISAIDPRGAEQRAEAERRKRWVRIQPGTEGISWLDGTLTGTDGHHLDHTLNRIAACLKANGDTDNREARRSSALGILSNPALALALLHRDDARRATKAGRDSQTDTDSTLADGTSGARPSGHRPADRRAGEPVGRAGHDRPDEAAAHVDPVRARQRQDDPQAARRRQGRRHRARPGHPAPHPAQGHPGPGTARLRPRPGATAPTRSPQPSDAPCCCATRQTPSPTAPGPAGTSTSTTSGPTAPTGVQDKPPSRAYNR